MKLLDTTFLIHYYADREDAVEYWEQNSSETFVTTGVNIKEFVVGHIQADIGYELTYHQLQQEFDRVRFHPYIAPFGFEAAAIEAQLRSRGEYEPRLAGDILIGGAARELQAEVVTQNLDDFNMMPGVDPESY